MVDLFASVDEPGADGQILRVPVLVCCSGGMFCQLLVAPRGSLGKLGPYLISITFFQAHDGDLVASLSDRILNDGGVVCPGRVRARTVLVSEQDKCVQGLKGVARLYIHQGGVHLGHHCAGILLPFQNRYAFFRSSGGQDKLRILGFGASRPNLVQGLSCRVQGGNGLLIFLQPTGAGGEHGSEQCRAKQAPKAKVKAESTTRGMGRIHHGWAGGWLG